MILLGDTNTFVMSTVEIPLVHANNRVTTH